MAPGIALAGDHQDRDREVSVKETLDTDIPPAESPAVELNSTATSGAGGFSEDTEDELRERTKKQGGMATEGD
ncbi:MAG: hypothetical protein R3245_12255 [Kiloniellales bacterium]|nr:hypothetical protein [Kiloniellales bacterium]